MNLTIAILIATYLIGAFLSHWMLRTEHESEKEVYTKGDRVIGIMLSLLSWLMVLIQLTRSWFANIGKTGYWDKPVKEQPAPQVKADKA